MKAILTKEQIITLGKEIEAYGNCDIELKDMKETEKYVLEHGFSKLDWSSESYVSNLVRAEALRLVLMENE